MASEIIRVGRGREKVTEAQLNYFLSSNGLSSLDELPLCRKCGKRKVHFVVKQNLISNTCLKGGRCQEEVSHERNLDRVPVKINVATRYYTREEINSFLDKVNWSSLEDRPNCECDCKVYVNIRKFEVGKYCGKDKCLHTIRSEAASKRNLKWIEEGKNPFANLTKETRREAARKASETIKLRYSKEEISERMRKASLSQSKECRSRAASNSNKTRWKKGNHSFQNLPKEKVHEFRQRGAFTKISKGQYSNIVSKIETECYNFLKDNLDNSLVHQFLIEGVRHAYDMYSPKYNCIIEFDGDYWHKDKQEYDQRLSEIAINNGYKIYRIKEYQFKESKDEVLKSIKGYLNGK